MAALREVRKQPVSPVCFPTGERSPERHFWSNLHAPTVLANLHSVAEACLPKRLGGPWPGNVPGPDPKTSRRTKAMTTSLTRYNPDPRPSFMDLQEGIALPLGPGRESQQPCPAQALGVISESRQMSVFLGGRLKHRMARRPSSCSNARLPVPRGGGSCARRRRRTDRQSLPFPMCYRIGLRPPAVAQDQQPTLTPCQLHWRGPARPGRLNHPALNVKPNCSIRPQFPPRAPLGVSPAGAVITPKFG